MREPLQLPPASADTASQERRGGVWGPRAARGPQPAESEGFPVLLRPVEVAGILGIGRTKVFTMIARNELPVLRIGKAVRIPKDLLEDWLRDQVTMPRGYEWSVR